ncbi:MAG TPA: class I SAM-dependent methyltransferase [Caulobacteraceae bacterium]|jgi:ubiquinone/menaquinone biosynthesis C-methylase UbiE
MVGAERGLAGKDLALYFAGAMSELPPNLRPEAFAGTADDYVRYRLPYPRAVLDGFLEEAQLALGGRLLDLACGPGRVSLPIADRFAEVWALDLEPEMIEAGRREASRLGITNVRWSVGRAETFDAPSGAFALVTIGEAFHRLDRPRVARLAFEWLRPGGALVTLGFPVPKEPAAWRHVVAEVVRDFIGDPARRLGGPNTTPLAEHADQEREIRDAGFVDVTTRSFAFSHEWTLETLLGNVRSTSILSRAALGRRHPDFEAALEKALIAFDSSGRYREDISCGYTFARRP